MDKKTEFNTSISVIKKLITGGLLMFGANQVSAAAVKYQEKQKIAFQKFEVHPDVQTLYVQSAKTNYDAIKLNTMKDMEKLFDMSLNIIFAELILEEVPMKGAYDDGGKFKGQKNTFGVGSTFAPLDFSRYSDTTAKWYHLYTNPKTFSTKTVTYEQMLQLVIGWGRYRKITQNSKTKKFETRKTVLQRMFNLLKGASLRPNEFAALYCAAYNNEENIQKLCPFVREHYKNRIACANKIMTWCNSGPANGGTKDRCEFEALVYLNVDGFCEDMLEMYTSPKARASCINIEGVNAITLTKENFETFSKNAKNKYKKVIYRSGIGPGDICPKLKKYFKNPLVQKAGTKPSLQKQYEEALVLYRNGDYKKALSKLLAVEANGAFGCDLLNDIAVTFLKLNQYDDCIKYCQKILKTADKKEYAKACYNAGCAYEKKGMYDKAIANYTQALNYYKTYGVSKEDKSVDYQKIYENAISRVMKAKKDSVNTNTKQR